MFMEPTWGPSGADRTQVGPCWPHEFCYLLGYVPISSLPLKPRHIMALYHTFLFLLYCIISFIALFIKNAIHLYFNVENKLPGYVATRWSIVKDAKGCKREYVAMRNLFSLLLSSWKSSPPWPWSAPYSLKDAIDNFWYYWYNCFCISMFTILIILFSLLLLCAFLSCNFECAAERLFSLASAAWRDRQSTGTKTHQMYAAW